MAGRKSKGGQFVVAQAVELLLFLLMSAMAPIGSEGKQKQTGVNSNLVSPCGGHGYFHMSSEPECWGKGSLNSARNRDAITFSTGSNG